MLDKPSCSFKVSPAPVLPYGRIVNAKSEPHNWLTYWGGYDSSHFSNLDQITPANVSQLQAKWVGPMPGTTGTTGGTGPPGLTGCAMRIGATGTNGTEGFSNATVPPSKSSGWTSSN